MKKRSADAAQSQIPIGYPLSYFAHAEPFSDFVNALQAEGTRAISGGHKKLQHPKNVGKSKTGDTSWLDEVALTRFEATEVVNRARPSKTAQKRIRYIIEFSTRREVRLLLPNPKSTVCIFGTEQKEGAPPAKAKITLLTDTTGERIQSLSLEGHLQFELPSTLLYKVVEVQGEWQVPPSPKISIPLGTAKIVLNRGRPPRLLGRAEAPAVFAKVQRTGLVIKLGRISLGGTSERPMLRFHPVQLAFL